MGDEAKAVRNRELRETRRALLIKMAGGRCSVCGSTHQLEFHHKDSATKEFTIRSGNGASWDRVVAEAKKCILLCRKHHRELHGIRGSTHGTRRRYHNGCRCEECRAAQRNYQRAYNARKRVEGS